MAIKGTFYPSHKIGEVGDRPCYYSDYNDTIKDIIGDGVATRGTALVDQMKVSSKPSTMQSQVNVGIAYIRGIRSEIYDSPELVLHNAADVSNPRIDTIVLESNYSADVRNSRLLVLEGVPASSPVAPSITQTETIFQYALCDVLIPAGATDSDNFTYTDRRAIANLPLYLSTDNYQDGSVTDDKLGTNVKVGNTTELDTIDKSSVVKAVNEVNETASTAKSTADTAKSTADTAKSTADTAKTTADAAKSTADDAIATLPYCRVRNNQEQTSGSLVTWNNELSDEFNMFDPSNNTKITVPNTGEYLIQYYLRIKNTAEGYVGASFYINGTLTQTVWRYNHFVSGYATDIFIDASYLTKLNANDYIEIGLAKSISNKVTSSGSYDSFFTVKQLR